jgi:predicted ATPase with chaperone activity
MYYLPEFARHALEALRQPLEEGRVWVTSLQSAAQANRLNQRASG